MTADDLHKALTRFANNDLALARRHGDIHITETCKGLLSLAYNRARRSYKLVACGLEPVTLASGKAATVRRALVNLYAVDEG